MQGKVRLIGGKWRSRKLDVIDLQELRPTPDRVRETLFNWLTPYITGANCLDLFAGTGVLGFEALSRGAASVVMVDHNSDAIDNLKKQADKLEATDLDIILSDAFAWVNGCDDSFDIIFIDPPYAANLIEPSVDAIRNSGCIHPASLLYVESDSKILINNAHVQVIKSGNAGKVEFQLLTCMKDTQ